MKPVIQRELDEIRKLIADLEKRLKNEKEQLGYRPVFDYGRRGDVPAPNEAQRGMALTTDGWATITGSGGGGGTGTPDGHTLAVVTGVLNAEPLSGTIDARFKNLSGSIDGRFATITSVSPDGATLAAVTGVLNAIPLSGTIDSGIKSAFVSLQAGSTASLQAHYTAILAGTSASDSAVQVSLKAGVTASLQGYYTAILAGTSASDAAVQTSLKAGVTASFGSWTGDHSVIGSITASIGLRSTGRNAFVTTTAPDYTAASSWANGFTTFGPNAANAIGANIGIGYNTVGDYGEIFSLAPTVAWKPMVFGGSLFQFYSTGVEALALDASANTLIRKNASIVGSLTGSGDATFGRSVGVGIGVPTAAVDVARGSLSGGTAIFRGTAVSSHFNFSTDEHTYIRGGKAASQVNIGDTNTGGVRLGSTTNRVSVLGDQSTAGSITGSGDVTLSRGLTTAGSITGSFLTLNNPSAEMSFAAGYSLASISHYAAYGLTVQRGGSNSPARFGLYHTLGANTGIRSALSDTVSIGEIHWLGATDGSSAPTQGAGIRAVVEGTVSSNVLPSKLEFQTTTTNSPATRFTIGPSGDGHFAHNVVITGSLTGSDSLLVQKNVRIQGDDQATGVTKTSLNILAGFGALSSSAPVNAINISVGGKYDTQTSTGLARGVYAQVKGSSSIGSNAIWNFALYGEASGSQGNSLNVGVFGTSIGTGSNVGVYGQAYGGWRNYGGYFEGFNSSGLSNPPGSRSWAIWATGTVNIVGDLYVTGTIFGGGVGGGGIGGSGTSNQVPKFSAATTLTDSEINDDGNYISLTPAIGVHVDTAYLLVGNALNYYMSNEGLSSFYLDDTDDLTAVINKYGYNGGNTRFRNLAVMDGKEGIVAVFSGSDRSLTVEGPVGIGTRAGTAFPFMVKNTADANAGMSMHLDTDIDAAARGGVTIYRGSGLGTEIAGFNVAGGSGQFVVGSQAGDTTIHNYDPGSLGQAIVFGTGPDLPIRMRIKSDGRTETLNAETGRAAATANSILFHSFLTGTWNTTAQAMGDAVAILGTSAGGRSAGSNALFNIGIKGQASNAPSLNIGVMGSATGSTTNYAIYGSASGGATANYAAYFDQGRVYAANAITSEASITGSGFAVGTGGSSVPARVFLNRQTFTSNGTYTPTVGTKAILVKMVGGGGGGGGFFDGVNGGVGAGGAAGSYFEKYFSSLTSATGSIIIGAGGTGGDNAAGGNGGDTSIGINLVTYVAKGGGGGGKTQGYNITTEGLPQAGTSVGDVYYDGEAGTCGSYLNMSQPGTVVISGRGGSGPFGTGGAECVGTAGANSRTGRNPSGRGAGGGGGQDLIASGVHFSGSWGTPGVLIIDEYG